MPPDRSTDDRAGLLAPLDRTRAADEVAGAFRAAYGHDPHGVWSAPGRVNLIGEHVDYTGGLCLPLALPHRTFVAVAPRTDGVLRIGGTRDGTGWTGPLAEVRPGRPDNWAAYVAGVPWALAHALPHAEALRAGWDLLVHGGVPIGSGLSSSAALECSVAVALAELAGLDRSDGGRATLAAACVRAENEIVGAPTGGLDQTAALRCRPGAAMLLDCRDGATRQVPLDLAGAGLTLLVIDTRATHTHSAGGYGQRRAELERALTALGVREAREIRYAALDAALDRLADPVGRARVRHAVTEIERVRWTAALLDAGQVRRIGPLLDASHESLRTDYEVSCPELDLAVTTARAAGALGARMTGGGFGGSAIALVDSAEVDRTATRVADAFADAALRSPRFLTAVPSAPADRDR